MLRIRMRRPQGNIDVDRLERVSTLHIIASCYREEAALQHQTDIKLSHQTMTALLI